MLLFFFYKEKIIFQLIYNTVKIPKLNYLILIRLLMNPEQTFKLIITKNDNQYLFNRP